MKSCKSQPRINPNHFYKKVSAHKSYNNIFSSQENYLNNNFFFSNQFSYVSTFTSDIMLLLNEIKKKLAYQFNRIAYIFGI